jgi:hypothetical protein
MDKDLLPGTWRLYKMIWPDGSVISYTEKDGWEQYIFKSDGTVEKEYESSMQVQRDPHFEEWSAVDDRITIYLAGKPAYTVEALSPEELILKNTDRNVQWGYRKIM